MVLKKRSWGCVFLHFLLLYKESSTSLYKLKTHLTFLLSSVTGDHTSPQLTVRIEGGSSAVNH